MKKLVKRRLLRIKTNFFTKTLKLQHPGIKSRDWLKRVLLWSFLFLCCFLFPLPPTTMFQKHFPEYLEIVQKDFLKFVFIMFATSALYICILRALVEKSASRGAVVGCFFENPDSIKPLRTKSHSQIQNGVPKKIALVRNLGASLFV